MARINPNEADKYQSGMSSEWFSMPNDGDVARVQFMADTYDELEVYTCHRVKVNDKERYVDCLRTYDQPIDNCPFCAAGIPVKPARFVIMYQHDDGKVKIWERGTNFISKLQGLFNRYSPLSNYVFEIERHGKAGDKDTKYDIYPMDQVEPVDLTDVDYPELLGGIILDKTAEEMEIYIDTGSFPEGEQSPAPTNRRGPARNASSSAPRRKVPAQAEQPAPPSRGPARSSRRGDKEVF